MLSVATPAAFSVPVPSGVAPSTKLTVPVAAPPAPVGVTVAVSVTVPPYVSEFVLACSAVDVATEVADTVTATAPDVLAASLSHRCTPRSQSVPPARASSS